MPKKIQATAPKNTDDAVRARAYLLWEADGRPDGRAEHYWQLAQAEPEPVKRARSAKASVPAAEKKPREKVKA